MVRQKSDQSRPDSVETRIMIVGSDLARSFTGVLNAIPGGPHRPQWLARLLGVNIVLTSRILKAAQQQDPIAVAHMIPGPEPLRRLLRAAQKKKVDPALIREAHAAVDRFAQLIASEAGDRSALDALISGWLPDARERVELIAKQSIFRGISQLLGTACDLEHCSILLYPTRAGAAGAEAGESQTADRADVVALNISHGLRRVRPGLVVKYDTVHADTSMLTVAGQPVTNLRGLLLEEFCSKPLPELDVTEYGDKAQYTLRGDDVGVRSAVNLVHATFLPGRKELHRAADKPARKITQAIGIGTPAKSLTFDVLLHQDIYPGQEPALNVYRTAGVVSPKDGNRDVDRLDMIESVQSLGRGIAKLRAAENPAYQEMIRYVCEQRQWDAGKLRGYRARIKYPVYSSEIEMSFELPADPHIH